MKFWSVGFQFVFFSRETQFNDVTKSGNGRWLGLFPAELWNYLCLYFSISRSSLGYIYKNKIWNHDNIFSFFLVETKLKWNWYYAFVDDILWLHLGNIEIFRPMLNKESKVIDISIWGPISSAVGDKSWIRYIGIWPALVLMCTKA